jgi:PAS domain S-box-containing protein
VPEQELDAREVRLVRQATLAAEVAIAMATGGSVGDLLGRACEATVKHLDAAFARIWTVDPDGKTLVLQASAGLYTHLDGAHGRVPIGKFKIGMVAAERRPHLTNDVLTDPRVGDHAWARREGLISFAGYPLLVEEQLVGVVAMFARHPLASDTLDTLASISNTVGVGIERKRIETAIRESEQYYRFMADAVPNQVWTALPNGALEYVNRRVMEYFGRSFVEMIGAGWQDVVHPDDLGPCVTSWTHSLRTGEPYEFEFRLRRASDGVYLAHIARALPFRSPSGEIVKWFGTNTDISERKRDELERDRLIHALERSNAELDQFAYVASHDLKAPLRGMANLSRWVEEDVGDKLSEESRQHLTLMRGRAHRMEALIDGILSYARAGRAGEKSEDVDVGKLIGEVVGLLAPPSGMQIEIGPGMPVLQTERVPLQQMFLNFIGNAVKHTRRADAHIRIEVKDSGGYFQFSVADNGPGIAPQYHDRIWGIFQTLEARDKVEGTGIGLSIVKKLAEARGGRVWVESSLGAGATFHFLWPKCPGPQGDPQTQRREPPKVDGV